MEIQLTEHNKAKLERVANFLNLTTDETLNYILERIYTVEEGKKVGMFRRSQEDRRNTNN